MAPQAYAHAERLRTRADQAHDDGKPAVAQILGEHAIVAYEHAFVLARLARAERALASAELELDRAEKELAALDAQQTRAAAEAEALEMRVNVARDAIPLTPNTPASAEREAARLEAARALASQARLLCSATAMLAGPSAIESEREALAKLDAELASAPKVAPIDEAIRARSACLGLLSGARRERTAKAPAAGVVDALLAELSRNGDLYPFRDDRGVVVVLRDAFDKGAAPTKAGAERLSALGRVAKAHPDFPVLVVVHSAGRPGADHDRRAKAAVDALAAAGASKLESRVVGSAQPVVDPKRAGASARNERIEIVFVAPTS